MGKEISIKDRDKDIEFFRLALMLADINIPYKECMLIKEIYEKTKELGGKFSVSDAVEIKNNWIEKTKF